VVEARVYAGEDSAQAGLRCDCLVAVERPRDARQDGGLAGGTLHFHTAITFETTEVPDNLKRFAGFIRGIRPGLPAAAYL
jgi:hypothetical protein